MMKICLPWLLLFLGCGDDNSITNRPSTVHCSIEILTPAQADGEEVTQLRVFETEDGDVLIEAEVCTETAVTGVEI